LTAGRIRRGGMMGDAVGWADPPNALAGGASFLLLLR